MKSFFRTLELSVRNFVNDEAVNLSVVIGDGLDTVDVFLGGLDAVLLTHGDVLGDGDGPVPASVRLVKQLAES